MILTSTSVAETREIGARLASRAKKGDVYALDGDLGCGKTELVRGFIGYFDQSIIVRSPSFSIVNTYLAGGFQVYHFDFYRLGEAGELFEIGFDEYTGSDGICIIEWASMFPEVLPENTTMIRLFDKGPSLREIHLATALS